jgi:Protein of unknown function (DUF3037)
VRAPCSFDYAIVRVIPRVEREEFVNAGVIVYCFAQDFLGARIELDEARLLALAPDADLPLIRRHLATIPRVCAGGASAGPIGLLSQRERFNWLVAPRSTILQTSPAHSGMCADPEAALDRLIERGVRVTRTI